MAIVTADLPEDQALVITNRPVLPIPPYFCAGRRGMLKKHKIEGFDLMLVLANLSAIASNMFWTLCRARDVSTNTARLKSSTLTKYEQAKITKAYKELERVKLLVRYKKEHYLINPKAVLPYFEDFPNVWDFWVETRTRKHLTY